jgi:ABC-type Mn2+/Zn2+ transport system permease subunit
VTLSDYLNDTFVQNALIAATLVAMTSGLIGPFVIIRDLAFAVHGSAELAFTGAAAGLLAANNPVLGALLGSLVVATAIGLLGVPTRLVGLLFVYLLALTVTEAAQIVGTLLVLSLTITPAAAATRLTARTPALIALSIAFCLIAADGGLLLGLIYPNVKASVFISTISFAIYAVIRLAASGFPLFSPRLGGRRGARPLDAAVAGR